jgi:hypothetical protein
MIMYTLMYNYFVNIQKCLDNKKKRHSSGKILTREANGESHSAPKCGRVSGLQKGQAMLSSGYPWAGQKWPDARQPEKTEVKKR